MLTSIFNKPLSPFVDFYRAVQKILEQSDRDLCCQIRDRQLSHPNPLTRYGRKCFSQSDEDGITIEIIRRLGIERGCFAEFGVGDGLENNTLILLALGWKGFWVGGEDIAFRLGNSSRLAYTKAWITRENIEDIYCPPYYFSFSKYGNKASIRVVETIVAG